MPAMTGDSEDCPEAVTSTLEVMAAKIKEAFQKNSYYTKAKTHLNS